MQPREFDWKEEGDHSIGFIAEEAEGVLPDLVTLNDEGKVGSFKYDAYTAVLTKAIQEQQEEIDSLRGEVNSLREEIEYLKVKINGD